MTLKLKQRLGIALAVGLLAWPVAAHPQQQGDPAPAITNAPDASDEPSLDDLLGLDEDAPKQADPDTEKPQPDDHDHDHDHQAPDADPELNRELERRLSGQEASQQFEQAIQEMADVAARLSEEADAGIDTQRMQDEIILKLEQIISSAEKSPSQQQSKSPKPGEPGPPRAADQGGQPQPGEKPGDKPGDKPGEKPGDKPGQAEGEKPNGDQPGQQPGEKLGEKPGQPGDKPSAGGKESGNTGQQGAVQFQELSMKDLREGEWGNLPPRLRNELAESLSETFNPVYRAATEAFYRRIAELSQQDAEDQP